MANVKISQLPAVSSVSGTDVLPVVASTTTSKLTITDLANSLPQVTSSLTASYVLGGAGNAFPFTGSALITGSLGIVGPTQIDSEQLGGLALGITGSIVASNGSLKIQTSTSDVAGGFFVSPGSDYLSFGQQNLSPELYILLSGSNGQLPKPVATRFYSTKGFEFLTDFGQSVEISSSLKVSGSAEFQNGVTGSFSGDGSGLTGITATVAQAVTASGSSIYSTNPSTSGFDTTNGIFLGSNAGSGTNGSDNLIAIGQAAGGGNSNAQEGIFIGTYAGQNATNAIRTIAIGMNGTGQLSTHASHSVFIGDTAGYIAPGAGYSVMIGTAAGYVATNANYANFIGNNAGQYAGEANNSNFIGVSAGASAATASYSNFIGYQAGYNATNAANSIFIGTNAGNGATNANGVFLGPSAGLGAREAVSSFFVGENAGWAAVSASNSTFIGLFAGQSASSASLSTIIGYKTGYIFPGNPGENLLGSNNIIIGTGITLESGRQNSINLGGVIFATGSYSDINNVGFSGSMTDAKVGINKVLPEYTLDVSGSGNYAAGLTVSGSFIVTGSFIVPSEVDANPATGSMYVEPAANKLWVYTGNSATGWVTSSLGF